MYTKNAQVLFRNMLAAARKNSGLTQAVVAKKLKVPQSFVSKYENGERKLDFLEFLLVADALKINPTTFIKKFNRKKIVEQTIKNIRLDKI